jgi:hypothetical protein
MGNEAERSFVSMISHAKLVEACNKNTQTQEQLKTNPRDIIRYSQNQAPKKKKLVGSQQKTGGKHN